MKALGVAGSLKQMLSRKSPFNSGSVGVEIGSDWIKIVQKDRAQRGQAAYRVDLLKLAEIKESLATAIEDSFLRLKLNQQHVVACIPRHLVTVRLLDLPATDPKEISDMIDLQVAKQTPYAKEDIVFAHKIIETGASGYTKVMLAIIARNIVSERTETLAKAGLTVKRVAISSEGVFNWFRGAYLAGLQLPGAQAVLLVDVDSNYSDFIVIRNGKMVFTRNILIGANHLIREDGDWRAKFLEELKRSLERYQGAEKHSNIAHAYLSGAGPSIKDLNVFLSAALEISVKNADSLQHFDLTGAPGIPRDEKLQFVSLTQLLGITQDEDALLMDLTPLEQKVQNVMERKAQQLTLTGILAVAIVTALSFLCLTNLHMKNAYLENLKKTIARIAVEAEGVDKMRAVIDLVEQRLDSRGSSLEFINEIYKVTPREISLTDVRIDEKQMVALKGHGFAMSDVFKYVKLLEESGLFAGVKTDYTRAKNSQGSEFAEFGISCAYQK
jgi:Tfp pilus assembly PilM family ATPase